MLTHNPEMPWQEFARLTIQTEDLDPVYCAMARSGWETPVLMRWCVAFCTYYHAGTACQLCDLEGDAFWSELWNRYGTAPRAAERRHFRGEAGKKAIIAWRERFGTPEKMAIACMPGSFKSLYNAGIPQVATYFTWKWMDFRESVFGYPVNWTGAEKALVALPCAGLEYLFPGVKPAESIMIVSEEIAKYAAPPRFERNCGLPEAETVACMAKGYYLNKNPIGHDILDKRTALAGYGERAQQLLAVMPKEPFDAI